MNQGASNVTDRKVVCRMKGFYRHREQGQGTIVGKNEGCLLQGSFPLGDSKLPGR